MHSDGTATDGTIRAADAVTIRAARPDDIVSVVQLHSDAFHDIFTAAFGAAHVQRGIDAMVLAWRRQGVLALRGMAVATLGAQLVGTIALRTAEMRDDRLPPAELAFHQVLGWWGATRAMLVLSRIEHHVAQDEGYITDVAVHTAYRRRGIAQALLQRAEAEARARGKHRLGLYVAQHNHDARRLYRRSGFDEHHTQRSIITGWLLAQPAWVYMQKPLAGDGAPAVAAEHRAVPDRP
jgi:ribosomal protein S18 acetylase RimI-like enzyme